MDSRLLPPIPTPPSQRWREVRLLYLPRATFALAIGLVVWMWGNVVAPSSMVAEAEIVGSELRSSQAGVLASLKVTLNQPVRAGEVVGHVATANPRLLEATLAVIRAEVGMISATMAGTTDRQRVALEFERMQLDWMSHRVERASLKGRLQQAEADLARLEPLHKTGVISDENYTQLKIARDSLLAQLEEENKLISRLEPVLMGSTVSEVQAAGLSGESAIASAIKVEEAKLRLAEEQLAPVALISPIDGVVSHIFRRQGEAVAIGEVVAKITATKAERLAGYVLQPLTFEPKPGMAAVIRTRSTPVKSAATTITHVAPALEPVTPTIMAALRLPPTPLPESALRVEFALPAGLTLRPGEHVDIVMR